MNEYELLSAIYKILGESPLEILNKVIKNANQPAEIIEIIKALRNVKAHTDQSFNSKPLAKKGSEKKPLTVKTGLNKKVDWSPQSKRMWDSIQFALLDRKKHKIKNDEVVKAFQISGLKTEARGKEGRQKMLLIIKSSLENIEDNKRIKIIEEVSSILGLSQTKGWMEVIKATEY